MFEFNWAMYYAILHNILLCILGRDNYSKKKKKSLIYCEPTYQFWDGHGLGLGYVYPNLTQKFYSWILNPNT